MLKQPTKSHEKNLYFSATKDLRARFLGNLILNRLAGKVKLSKANLRI